MLLLQVYPMIPPIPFYPTQKATWHKNHTITLQQPHIPVVSFRKRRLIGYTLFCLFSVKARLIPLVFVTLRFALPPDSWVISGGSGNSLMMKGSALGRNYVYSVLMFWFPSLPVSWCLLCLLSLSFYFGFSLRIPKTHNTLDTLAYFALLGSVQAAYWGS